LGLLECRKKWLVVRTNVQPLFSASQEQCDGTPAMIKTETSVWMIQARSGNGDLKTYCSMVESAEEARAVTASHRLT
jgi:hypothetical protein